MESRKETLVHFLAIADDQQLDAFMKLNNLNATWLKILMATDSTPSCVEYPAGTQFITTKGKVVGVRLN